MYSNHSLINESFAPKACRHDKPLHLTSEEQIHADVLFSYSLPRKTTFLRLRAYIGSQPNDFGLAVIVAKEWAQDTTAVTYPKHSTLTVTNSLRSIPMHSDNNRKVAPIAHGKTGIPQQFW